MAYSNISVAYYEMNDYDMAIEYNNKSIDIYKKVYGEDSYKAAEQYFLTAKFYEAKKDYLHAIEAYCTFVEADRKKYGDESKQVIIFIT